MEDSREYINNAASKKSLLTQTPIKSPVNSQSRVKSMKQLIAKQSAPALDPSLEEEDDHTDENSLDYIRAPREDSINSSSPFAK